MRIQGGIWTPLLYLLIFGSIGGICGSIINSVIQAIRGQQPEELQIPMGFAIIGSIIFIPIGVAIGSFIGAAIMHLFLLIFGAASGGYEATYRVVCYSAAPNVLAVVPIIGGFAAGIWILILEVVGLKEAHRTDYWRVSLAVLAPTILLLFCCCISAMIIPAVIVAAQR